MKKFLLLAFLVHCGILSAQSEIEKLVEQGIVYHDDGLYEEAIKNYEKALELDPKSTLANFEISYSYMGKGDYKKAIKYADIVIKQKSTYVAMAYVNKGNALDLMGKSKQAIKAFKKGIKETSGDYLLHYNLAITYQGDGNSQEAITQATKAIEKNPDHANSHFLLLDLYANRGKKVQSFYAANYFLLLQPNTPKAKVAYQILQNVLAENLVSNKGDKKTINITLDPNDNDGLMMANMMFSLQNIDFKKELDSIVEIEPLETDEAKFTYVTGELFKTLGSLKTTEDSNIWWDFYIPFFDKIGNSPHVETYCMYISQSENEKAATWVEENKDKLNAFADWLNEG